MAAGGAAPGTAGRAQGSRRGRAGGAQVVVRCGERGSAAPGRVAALSTAVEVTDAGCSRQRCGKRSLRPLDRLAPRFVVRAIRPDDETKLRAFFPGLSPASQHRPFLSVI